VSFCGSEAFEVLSVLEEEVEGGLRLQLLLVQHNDGVPPQLVDAVEEQLVTADGLYADDFAEKVGNALQHMFFLSAMLLKIVFVLLLRLAPLSLPELLAMLPGSELLPAVSINLSCCCYVNILFAGVNCWYFSLALHHQPFAALPLSRPSNIQGNRP
jgi:hypothetical protein